MLQYRKAAFHGRVRARNAEVNLQINALPEVLTDQALAAADACDRAQAAGLALSPLRGMPVTIQVKLDTPGLATTDGIVAAKDNIARSDSPRVAHLCAAGAVIEGRSNTPAFSLRWSDDVSARPAHPQRG